MRTSTIDHSPTSHEQQPVAPTTVRAVGERAVVHSTHETDTAALRDRFNRVGASVRKQIPMHYNFLTLAKVPAKRAEMLWRQHQYVEAPLMELYEDYSETDQPFGNFVNTVVGIDPSTEPTKHQRQSISVVTSSIQHGLAVRQLQALLDQHEVPYATPHEDGIKDGVDLYIKGKPYRFKLSGGATGLISAKVDGTYQRALPTPYPGGIPSRYQLPAYSDKVQLGILHSLSVPIEKSAVHSVTTSTSAQEATTKQVKPHQPQVVARKPKSAKQIAHEQRVAEIQAKKAALRLAHKQRVEEAQARKAKEKTAIATVVGMPSHTVGTDRGYVEPPYATKEERESLRGEQYALDIIDEALGDQVIDGYKVTPLQASELIAASIHPTDSAEVQMLKKIAERLCANKAVYINNANDLLTLTDTLRSSELRDFIAHIYTWSHPDSQDTDKIIASFMNLSGGFRVEASFIKLARKAGYDVEAATHEQDTSGVDCFIDGVPFNIKSSTRAAENYAKHNADDPYRSKLVKFTPPFTATDFAGELTIPDDRLDGILEETSIRQMIDQAIGIYLGEYQPAQDIPQPVAEVALSPEQFRQAEIDRELDKLALGATRHWRRKVKKNATERWG